jgi:phytoene dehydrogenase-like protein
VIVATELRSARRLLDDDALRWEGARTVLLDVGLRARRGDPFLVSDLDEACWAERFSARDRSLAPPGHSLVQVQGGLRAGETLEEGVARLERLLDVGYKGWRDREVWRRRSVVDGASGALDLPGTTWRDRPAIERGDGVFLAGDAVAAPGMLSDVAFTSAVTAARLAGAAATGAEVPQPVMQPALRPTRVRPARSPAL